MFDNKFYKQIQGTAMGATFAPNYANLFMGYWEHHYINNKEANSLLKYVLFWKCYIDDILLCFIGNEEDLFAFKDYINSTHPSLKFTMEHNKTQIHFLDLLITVKDTSKVVTTIFRKPTDRNTILHARSHHPKRMIENIPYGQFLRLKRNYNSEEDFVLKAQDMHRCFTERGYQKSTIIKAYNKAKEQNRNVLLNPTTVNKTCDNRTIFISEFNKKSQEIKRIIMKHWKILNCDPNLKALASSPPRFCFRRGRNLKDHLVSSSFMSPSPNTNWLQLKGNYRCGRCTHCSNTYDTKTFKHPHTGQSYEITEFINCMSTHVIYKLICPCGKIYVGQTILKGTAQM